ncbi:hypothetical protein ACFY05_06735 [Microtetraspora fusca]|uniref:DUF2335 domain-containing protein n=1 Tax=Microtetraspora fusca TaxID=1997 RepID=A0ABW6V2E8_MICFU
MAEDQTPQETPMGLEIAMQWAQLPPEHLQLALKALEPQLKREHAYRMEALRIQQEHAQRAVRRKYAIYLTTLVGGFVIIVGLLVGGVITGINEEPWLAIALSSPSLVALISIFALLRSSGEELRELRRVASFNSPATAKSEEQEKAL